MKGRVRAAVCVTDLDAVVGYPDDVGEDNALLRRVTAPCRLHNHRSTRVEPRHVTSSVPISNLYDALFPFTGYNCEQTLKLDKPT